MRLAAADRRRSNRRGAQTARAAELPGTRCSRLETRRRDAQLRVSAHVIIASFTRRFTSVEPSATREAADGEPGPIVSRPSWVAGDLHAGPARHALALALALALAGAIYGASTEPLGRALRTRASP